MTVYFGKNCVYNRVPSDASLELISKYFTETEVVIRAT
jgi:hypothetical protein